MSENDQKAVTFCTTVMNLVGQYTGKHTKKKFNLPYAITQLNTYQNYNGMCGDIKNAITDGELDDTYIGALQMVVKDLLVKDEITAEVKTHFSPEEFEALLAEIKSALIVDKAK